MSVRILLVGDPQCGKTSIILSLVGEEFPLKVPARAEEITIPGDVTPEKVPTHIVDYSEHEQSQEDLEREITKAQVVCVVYDLTDERALDRVLSHWVPLIQKHSEDAAKPIVLAGNKADLSYNAELQSDRLQYVLNMCVEVETGIECSAKELHNVSELFYFAQKVVLHPTAPLYSPNHKQLKPECADALERVFKICDADNDGILNDQELNDFQIRCFDAPLQPQALQDVKNIVERNIPSGVTEGGLTLEGFLFLNKLFIQRGRHETAWKILRRFGYSNDLTLKDDYTQPIFSPQPGNTVQLSHSGYQFITDLFQKYDKDGDNALSPAEQEDLLSLCPDYPWDEQLIALTVETNSKGWVTLSGFLAFWTLQTSMDYSFTAQFLAWTGYPILTTSSLATALRDVGPADPERCVYHCRVMGGKGCGKTSFVRGLIGQSEAPPGDEEEAMTIKGLTLPNSSHAIYLVLQESSYDAIEGVEALEEVLANNDVACLLYDSSKPDSFEVSRQIFDVIDTSVTNLVPCVFVATKCDLPKVRQQCEVSPEELCKDYHLPPPRPISLTTTDLLTAVYTHLTNVARDPTSNLPSSLRIPSWVKWAGLGLIITTGLGALVYLLTNRLKVASKPRPF